MIHLARVFDCSLCSSQTCDRHAERRAGHIIQTSVMAELDSARVAAMLTADAEVDVRTGCAAQFGSHLDQFAHTGLIQFHG